jgi:hypothetical protein
LDGLLSSKNEPHPNVGLQFGYKLQTLESCCLGDSSSCSAPNVKAQLVFQIRFIYFCVLKESLKKVILFLFLF